MAKADELNAKPDRVTLTLPDGNQGAGHLQRQRPYRLIFDTLYSTDKNENAPRPPGCPGQPG